MTYDLRLEPRHILYTYTYTQRQHQNVWSLMKPRPPTRVHF